MDKNLFSRDRTEAKQSLLGTREDPFARVAKEIREGAHKLMERASLDDSTGALSIGLRKRWQNNFRFGTPSRDERANDLLMYLPAEVEWAWFAVESDRYNNRELRVLHGRVNEYLDEALDAEHKFFWDWTLDEDDALIRDLYIVGYDELLFGPPRKEVPLDLGPAPFGIRDRLPISEIEIGLERAAEKHRLSFETFVAPFNRGKQPVYEQKRREALAEPCRQLRARGATFDQLRFVLSRACGKPGWKSESSIKRMVEPKNGLNGPSNN